MQPRAGCSNVLIIAFACPTGSWAQPMPGILASIRRIEETVGRSRDVVPFLALVCLEDEVDAFLGGFSSTFQFFHDAPSSTPNNRGSGYLAT